MPRNPHAFVCNVSNSMYQTILQKYSKDFVSVIDYLNAELAKIRTGRAHPSVLDSVRVDAYGSTLPLVQTASVSVPEPRLIVVQPWDRSMISAIESGIRQADLGLNPSNDGVVIRLSVPALTQERREQIVKNVNQKAEEGRIRLRGVREEIWKEIQSVEASGGMSEDEKFQGKEVLQKTVDVYNKKIEEIRAKKEQEVMTV